MLPCQKYYRTTFKRRNVCCGLKSQGSVATYWWCRTTYGDDLYLREEKGREVQKWITIFMKRRWTMSHKFLGTGIFVFKDVGKFKDVMII